VIEAYFVDSSALVKRYVTETGTPWIRLVTHPSAQNRLIIARITWVEVLSALARRQREGSLSSEQVAGAIDSFRYDLDTHYQVVEVNRTLADAAGELVTKYPLRAYDAVQLASALYIHPSFARAKLTSLTFVAADDRLLAIAQSEGLRTDNPNHHP
jgi:predicted nucleic acid-binding protein